MVAGFEGEYPLNANRPWMENGYQTKKGGKDMMRGSLIQCPAVSHSCECDCIYSGIAHLAGHFACKKQLFTKLCVCVLVQRQELQSSVWFGSQLCGAGTTVLICGQIAFYRLRTT